MYRRSDLAHFLNIVIRWLFSLHDDSLSSLKITILRQFFICLSALHSSFIRSRCFSNLALFKAP